MTASNAPRSFVLFRAGSQRYALPAEQIEELAPPVRLHKFAHATASIVGVIVRRGRIVPVHDVLTAGKERLHRFYLIAKNKCASDVELNAVPVDGECMMQTAEVTAAPVGHANYICGSIAADNESWALLDFDVLLGNANVSPTSGNSHIPNGGQA